MQVAESHKPMGLFSADLYRSFFLGFGVTAVILAVNILPKLGGA